MFIIKRTDQGGGYVADPRTTGGSSYTRYPARARRYPTMEAAERDRCPGNEIIIDAGHVSEAFLSLD